MGLLGFTRQRPQVRNLQRPQEDTGRRAPSAEPEHPSLASGTIPELSGGDVSGDSPVDIAQKRREDDRERGSRLIRRRSGERLSQIAESGMRTARSHPDSDS
jgi:hypothetical protein